MTAKFSENRRSKGNILPRDVKESLSILYAFIVWFMYSVFEYYASNFRECRETRYREIIFVLPEYMRYHLHAYREAYNISKEKNILANSVYCVTSMPFAFLLLTQSQIWTTVYRQRSPVKFHTVIITSTVKTEITNEEYQNMQQIETLRN